MGHAFSKQQKRIGAWLSVLGRHLSTFVETTSSCKQKVELFDSGFYNQISHVGRVIAITLVHCVHCSDLLWLLKLCMYLYCNFTNFWCVKILVASDREAFGSLNFGIRGCGRDHSMCFSHLGVFLISVKPSTTENTENKTTPKICKITIFFCMYKEHHTDRGVFTCNSKFYTLFGHCLRCTDNMPLFFTALFLDLVWMSPSCQLKHVHKAPSKIYREREYFCGWLGVQT